MRSRSAAALALFIPGATMAAPAATRMQPMQAEAYDGSAPLSLLRPAPAVEPERDDRGPKRVPHEMQTTLLAHDPVLQDWVIPLAIPQMGRNFDGIGASFVGHTGASFETVVAPPDPQGDVGPSHYVQIVNSSFAIFAKDGHLLFGPMPTRTLFTGLGPPCETAEGGDGVVLYDPLADRWLLTQFAQQPHGTNRFFECIAVSKTADPMGEWWRYAYSYPYFNDYPKFAVWPDAYYVTYNFYVDENGDQFRNRAFCAFDRAKMLKGEPALQQCFKINGSVSGLTPADLDGPLAPPPNEPGIALGFGTNILALYRYHVDWATPGNSDLEYVAIHGVSPFAEACYFVRLQACVPQGGSSQLLDSLGDRMMFRGAYRNFGDHQSLIVNHSVMGGKVTGVRWYEVRNPGRDAVLMQQGTYAPDSSWRWLGSAAIDRAGNIGLGFNLSSAQAPVAIAYTGHGTGDLPGVMGQGEAVAQLGGTAQTVTWRWGDYSSMSVDPSDECTFWYTNQYIQGNSLFNWHTRIFTFQLPGCAQAADYSVWPSPELQTVGVGRSAAVSIRTGALRSGAEAKTVALTAMLTDVPPPTGVRLRVEPATVSPGQTATMSMVVDSGAALGLVSYVVQASALDGTSASIAGSAIVVDSDFSLSLEKTVAVVAAGGTTRVRVDSTQLYGTPPILSFEATHLRPGVTAAFDPPRIMSGDSTTLALTGSTDLPVSNTDIDVVAYSSGASHSVPLRVRAMEAPKAAITWPSAQAPVSGTAQVIAIAVTSVGTMLSGMALFVDGQHAQGVLTSVSPVIFEWNTRSVSDGSHELVVRAFDAQGGMGDSDPVSVWVQNKGDCGCAAKGGGWETLGLAALLVVLRRRRRR